MRALSPTERLSLQQASSPIALLRGMDCLESEAYELLWQLCTEDEDFVPQLGHLTCLLHSNIRASLSAHLVLARRLYELDEAANNHIVYNQLAIYRRLHAAFSMSEILEVMDDAPFPLVGLLGLSLLRDGAIGQIEQGWLSAVAFWYANGHHDARAFVTEMEEGRASIRDYVDLEAWQMVCLELATSQLISTNALFDWDTCQAATDDQLVAIGCVQSKASERFINEVVSRGAEILPLIQEAIMTLDLDEGRSIQIGAALVRAGVRIAVQEQVSLPVSMDAWIAYMLRESSPLEIPDEECMGWLRFLPIERAVQIVTENVSGYTVGRICGVVDDPRVFEAVVAHIDADPGAYTFSYHCGFVLGGAAAVAFAKEVLSERPSARVAGFLAEVLGDIETPESNEALSLIMHHKVKGPRSGAISRLMKRGKEGLVGVVDALCAGRKGTRQTGLDLLAHTNASRADKRAIIQEALAVVKHEGMKEALEAILAEDEEPSEEHPSQQVLALKVQVDRDLEPDLMSAYAVATRQGEEMDAEMLRGIGLSSLFLFLPYCDARGGRVLTYLIRFFRDEPMTPWIIAYRVSELQEMQQFVMKERIQRHLGALGPHAGDALCHYALAKNNQPLLLEALARIAPVQGLPLFLEAVTSTKKIVRQAAIDGLVTVGEEALPGLLPMLAGGKKAQRLVVASVLERIASPSAVEALSQALEKERYDDVKEAFELAIEASKVQNESASDEAPTINELEQRLIHMRKLRFPDFLDVSSLPELLWFDGTAFSEEATLGWLAQLTAEKHDKPNELARQMRRWMDPVSLDAFGRAIFSALLEKGLYKMPASWQWCRQQLSITALPSSLLEWSRYFDNKSTFRLLQHHGSRYAALLLHHLTPGASKPATIRAHQEIIALLPEDVRPTEEERSVFALEYYGFASSFPYYQPRPFASAEYEELDTEYCTVGLHLRVNGFPALGTLPEGMCVVPVSLERKERPDDGMLTQTLRDCMEKIKQMTALFDKDIGHISERLSTWREKGGRCSVAGWKVRFSQGVMGEKVTAALLFRTEDGVTFMKDMEGEPIDVHGHPVVLPHDGFVFLVDVEELSDGDRALWDERHRVLQREWERCLPEAIELFPENDPFQELRVAIDGGEWSAVCAVLDHWPLDESLELAFGYVASHVERDAEGVRVAPENWLASLVSGGHRLRQKHKGIRGKRLSFARKCLTLCNQLHWKRQKLQHQDIRAMGQASDALASIEHLVLEDVTFTANQDGLFAVGVSFPVLRSLALVCTRYSELAFPMFSSAAWLGSLESLSIRGFAVDGYELDDFFASCDWEHLQELDLRGTGVDVTGIQALARRVPAHLSILRMSFSSLGEGGLWWFIENNPWLQLKELHIECGWHHDPTIGLNCMEALASSKRFGELDTLSLLGRHNERNDTWVDYVLESTVLPKAALDSLRKESGR